MTRFDDAFAPIAVATRSGFDESLHHGAGVALEADGSLIAHVGDPRVIVYPRSCLKPMQAHAMGGLGLDLP
ncbi:MAG TPA: asparaginase, partial [Ilumatobacteraceae bacterium]|nr:asparaginase [Ilumatobacteraceae bacterium]